MENLTQGLTLETLPQAVTLISKDVIEIKRLLHAFSNEESTKPDCWFDLNEFCNYHPDKPSKATVYGWVYLGIIPVHKGAKKLRFLKSEIDNWLMQGRKKTLAEIAIEAELYCKTKKK